MDTSRLPAELEKAQELSRSGFNDVKRSIKALRPQVMEEKSFFASIHTSINEIMETTKVNIIFDNMLPPETQLESQVEISLFRAIQECITNSIRHGKAGKIEINLKQVDKHLQLMISDNGIGCANFKKGFGMKGLLERVEKLKGKVNYSSAEGKGFQTTISIPEEV
jgi:signal transduction histidine kinase